VYAVLFVPMFVVLGWLNRLRCSSCCWRCGLRFQSTQSCGLRDWPRHSRQPYVALIGVVALLIYLRKRQTALLQLGKLIAAGAITGAYLLPS
jgi:hypothetical protein